MTAEAVYVPTEEDANYARQCETAQAGLESALDAARDALTHAMRHYGELVDELFHVEYAEDIDGADLGELLDQAGSLVRSARRTAHLIAQRCKP